jgi:Zn-dependent protease
MKKCVLLIAPVLILLSLWTLTLTSAHANGVKTQLCLVIDGSGSITNAEWNLTVQAIARAINETVPRDGSVEITIVQFGYSPANGYARTEISPTVITSADYAFVASQVMAMPKGGGSTPTAHGLYLGWKEIQNSQNFQSSPKQVINLATDEAPNIRNNNATTDLDGIGGEPNARDDAIAVVNNAVNEGLDELDIEGINLANSTRDWFKNWIVRPQPGIIAPPFSKRGWIRPVANVTEFADTIDQKFQAIITDGTDVWVPSAFGALLAGALTVGVTSVISSLASAVSDPNSYPSQIVAQKINSFFPETVKKWLHEFISSKRKLVIEQHTGSPFTLKKIEIMSYVIALSVLTFAFSYAKAIVWNEILSLIPTVLATSIVVEFAKNYSIEVVARRQGVWTEHRLWYFGLATFLFSSLAFKVPFSSPSRLTHHSPKFTKRSLGLVSSATIFIALALAAVFYGLFTGGFRLIGNIGIVMCLTMAFFDSIPIPPMNGKDIYDWSKALWATLFIAAFSLYVLCLLLL